ncbi:MAG: DinB family protein [Acidobacteriota bacterium]|nr:DinB family protein [Acidobacteriota bacterium]
MTTMEHDKSLREHLIKLLNGGEAHLDFEAAVKDLLPALRGTRPHHSPHSAWELLEHMRIAQWDILEFCRNPKHVSPEFPKGYWPVTSAPTDESAWDKTVQAFRADLKAMTDTVADESKDLFAPIPHGDGQTLLREALLAADHSAYHLGQLVLLKKMLEHDK